MLLILFIYKTKQQQQQNENWIAAAYPKFTIHVEMSTQFMYPSIINSDKLPIILTKVRMLFDIHPKKSCYKIISQIKSLSWLVIGKEIILITLHYVGPCM